MRKEKQQVFLIRLIIITVLLFATSVLITGGCKKEPEQVDVETNEVEPTENVSEVVEPKTIEPVEPEISEAEQHYNAGLDFREKEQYEAAIAEFDAAVELDPEYAEAYYKRGNVYCRMGQLETGIEDLNKAIEIDPKFGDAYYDRGAAYCTLGQFAPGIEDLNEAIRLNPADAMGYGSRGNAYHELGEFDKAMRDCKKAIELDPEYGYAYYVLGNIYDEQEELEKALENYNEAIRLDPQLVWAYTNRAGVYHKLEQFEEAIQDLDKAIDLDPEDSSTYYNRGNAYCRLAQYENGIPDFDMAIDLDPFFTEAYFNRGLALGNVSRKEEAISDFEKFLVLTDDEIKAADARREIERLTRISLDVPSEVSPGFTDLAELVLSNDDLPEEIWLESFQEKDIDLMNELIVQLNELEDISAEYIDVINAYTLWLIENGFNRALSISSNDSIVQQEIIEFSSPGEANAAMLELPQLTLDFLSATREVIGFEVTTEIIEVDTNGLSPNSWGLFINMQIGNDSMSIYYIGTREANMISGITLMGSTITASPYSVETVDDALMISRMALDKIREQLEQESP